MVFGTSKKSEKKDRDFTDFHYEEVGEEEVYTSFISKTMEIEGEIFSDEDLTIEGRVKGIIEVSKTLTIGRSGDVTADINANVVKIIGKAKGNILAANKVEILSEGRYDGNIHSQKLVVSEGAILRGNINKGIKKKKAALNFGTKISPPEAEAETKEEKESEDLKKRKKKEGPKETKESVDSQEPKESEQPEEAKEPVGSK